MTSPADCSPTDSQVKAESAPFDREDFLKKSNASLKRIEGMSLLILSVSGALAFLLFKEMSLSILIGGGFAMMHFRGLHRMFQKRVLDPPAWLKTKFIYSSTLFLLICLFFWVIDLAAIQESGVIAGFSLMTGGIFFDSIRRT